MQEFPYLAIGPLTVNSSGQRQFRVWAPRPRQIQLVILRDGRPEVHPLRPEGLGYYLSEFIPAPAGTRYGFYLNGKSEKLYPDPASRFQPEGVHGPSEVVDLKPGKATGSYPGRSLKEAIIYELHIGTFTTAGTFDAAIDRLDYLAELGINVIELMPLNQTPGDRNWGYDGVLPFAVFKAYGGPPGLRNFLEAAHRRGIAVLIDVIYNHLGPEGNYLAEFFPVFTDQHRTPWGPAINFDDRQADGVRNYWLQNVRMWLQDYGADGLRIDAVHAIKDYSAEHFLSELSGVADEIAAGQNRELILLAECDLNAPRFIRSRQDGGYGLSGQWVDEFHHALHALLTGETRGYYEDFAGIEQLAKALREGYVYTGQYSPHRQRNFGRPAREHLDPHQLVVFLQNHDQVGNRMIGDRLSVNLTREKYLLGAGTYLLSPFTPLIFMGEEYGERHPFPYFVQHGDEQLIEAVRKGRAAEFAAFQTKDQSVPDPQAEQTFESAKLSWQPDDVVFEFYRKAIELRKAARRLSFAGIDVHQEGNLLSWSFGHPSLRAYANFGDEPVELARGQRVRLSNGAGGLAGKLQQLPAWGFIISENA